MTIRIGKERIYCHMFRLPQAHSIEMDCGSRPSFSFFFISK